MQAIECAKEIHIPIRQDPCVICFDEIDEKGNKCRRSESLLVARCNCDYAVHKECMNEWLANRPSVSVRCLICSSQAEPILSCGEKTVECLRRVKSDEASKKLLVVVGWILIFIFIWFVLGGLETPE